MNQEPNITPAAAEGFSRIKLMLLGGILAVSAAVMYGTFEHYTNVTARASEGALKEIAFVSHKGIYTEDLLSGKVTKLTDAGNNIQESPDGSSLVFDAYKFNQPNHPEKGGNRIIEKIDLTNPKAITELTTTATYSTQPSYVPDGRIVFGSEEANGRNFIEIMNGDGSDRHNLTSAKNPTHDFHPVAVDNSHIMFTQNNAKGTEFLVVDTGGIVTGPTPNQELSGKLPAVDPTSTKFAFVSTEKNTANTGYNHYAYAENLDGSDRIKLSNQEVYSDNVAWSHDGKYVMFTNRSHMYVVGSDGKNEHQLTDPIGSAAYDSVIPL